MLGVKQNIVLKKSELEATKPEYGGKSVFVKLIDKNEIMTLICTSEEKIQSSALSNLYIINSLKQYRQAGVLISHCVIRKEIFK